MGFAHKWHCSPVGSRRCFTPCTWVLGTQLQPAASTLLTGTGHCWLRYFKMQSLTGFSYAQEREPPGVPVAVAYSCVVTVIDGVCELFLKTPLLLQLQRAPEAMEPHEAVSPCSQHPAQAPSAASHHGLSTEVGCSSSPIPPGGSSLC